MRKWAVHNFPALQITGRHSQINPRKHCFQMRNLSRPNHKNNVNLRTTMSTRIGRCFKFLIFKVVFNSAGELNVLVLGLVYFFLDRKIKLNYIGRNNFLKIGHSIEHLVQNSLARLESIWNHNPILSKLRSTLLKCSD